MTTFMYLLTHSAAASQRVSLLLCFFVSLTNTKHTNHLTQKGKETEEEKPRRAALLFHDAIAQPLNLSVVGVSLAVVAVGCHFSRECRFASQISPITSNSSTTTMRIHFALVLPGWKANIAVQVDRKNGRSGKNIIST